MMKMLQLMRRCVVVLLPLCAALALPAQDRFTLTAFIRNQNGDSLPFARVRATGPGTDISTSANVRGQAILSLPVGPLHLTVSTLGYETVERDVTIDRRPQIVQIVLREVARQLSDVEVRASWIGIRGGVGDETTHEPLAGAVVTLSRGRVQTLSDSSGRFELPMAKAEGAALQIAKPGYQTKPVRVNVLGERPTDVVFFLTPGKDPLYMKVALGDLRVRMAASKINAFVATHEQLTGTQAVSLYDAIVSSGLLHRNNLFMGQFICLFVNGLARPGFPVNTIQVDDIDFIEVYGGKAEVTSTLMAEWPHNTPCTSHEAFFPPPPKRSSSNIVSIVSVWTRK